MNIFTLHLTSRFSENTDHRQLDMQMPNANLDRQPL